MDLSPISGFTHRFYRYPARFSPRFAAAAIDAFSRPGDLVLDPYMGGGTTIVEAMARHRTAVGCDLNSLAVFISRAKTTPLSDADATSLREWADETVPTFSYRVTPDDLHLIIDDRRTKNLTLPTTRPIKKIFALALHSLTDLSDRAAVLCRCALLNTGQWALARRARPLTLTTFRTRLRQNIHQMIADTMSFRAALHHDSPPPILIADTAAHLQQHEPFTAGARARLVVTSPPYPGIHVLYHRWQINGRRESPAPYWLADCADGHGASFYNFAYRSEAAADKYFAASLRTLLAIRKVMADDGYLVQLVAFANPRRDLPRYLYNMTTAGFIEITADAPRLWRTVPRRKWHATLKGGLPSAQEVLLVHRSA